MVSNAVRVEVIIPQGFNLFGASAKSRSKAAATAVWGQANIETNTAPFAIPVCSLLDTAGNYNPAKNCAADR